MTPMPVKRLTRRRLVGRDMGPSAIAWFEREASRCSSSSSFRSMASTGMRVDMKKSCIR